MEGPWFTARDGAASTSRSSPARPTAAERPRAWASGRPEVFLRPFPSGDGVWQVSTDGGDCPRFARAGKRLFYSRGPDIMEVSIDLEARRRGSGRRDGSSRVPSERLRLDMGFDMAPDGLGFVAAREVADPKATVPTLTLVESWFAEFQEPAGRPRS